MPGSVLPCYRRAAEVFYVWVCTTRGMAVLTRATNLVLVRIHNADGAGSAPSAPDRRTGIRAMSRLMYPKPGWTRPQSSDILIMCDPAKNAVTEEVVATVWWPHCAHIEWIYRDYGVAGSHGAFLSGRALSFDEQGQLGGMSVRGMHALVMTAVGRLGSGDRERLSAHRSIQLREDEITEC
jgi:hypothetical protein